MLASISASQFIGWMAYYSIEPFGEERADLRAAINTAVNANAHRDADRHAAFSPADFMPQFSEQEERPVKRQTWQEQLAIVEVLNARYGGKDLRTNA